MVVGRQKELNECLDAIEQSRYEDTCTVIIGIDGLFGVGKSTFVRELVKQLPTFKSCDAILLSNEDNNVESITDFAYNLLLSFKAGNDTTPRFRNDETEARLATYHTLFRGSGASLETIKEKTNSKDEQRLVIDTGNVVIESLIVDLMNTFYPITDEVTSLFNYIEQQEARKIVVVIDTFEKLSPTINNWFIESFIPYVFKKRFGDFRSYSSPYLSPELYVYQFFDFRFVFSGREAIQNTDKERRWDRWKDTLKQIHLETFTRQELEEYLAFKEIPASLYSNEVYGLTSGLPYLVTLWSDQFKARKKGADKMFLAQMVMERVFWYKTEEQKEWIKAAAFCSLIDANTLQCFPTITNQCNEAFQYLRDSKELTQPSIEHNNSFQLLPIISNNIKLVLEQESPTLFNEFTSISQLCSSVQEELKLIDNTHRNTLLQLSYFNHFNVDYAVQQLFPNLKQSAESVLQKYPSLFVKHSRTYSLVPKIKEMLLQYNFLRSEEKHLLHIAAVTELWDQRKSSLESMIAKIGEEQQGVSRKLLLAESEIASKSKQATEKQKVLQSLIVQTEELESTLKSKIPNRDFTSAQSAFLFGAVLAVVAYFSPEILRAFSYTNQETTLTIQRIGFSFAGVFGAIALFYFSRGLIVNSAKKKRNEIQTLYNSVVANRNNLRYELEQLEVELKLANDSFLVYSERAAELESKLKFCQQQLLEPFA